MSAAVRGQRRSIGEVMAALSTEFPDISISKIRFLEGQGLVNPERTHSGYRKFSDQDVARLRYVLRMQREQFLPLRVIKERLSVEMANGSAGAGIDVAPGESSAFVNGLIGRKDLLVDSGLSEAQLSELERVGMIKNTVTGKDLFYDADGLAMARLAARFLATGVEVRHMRLFKTSVDREVDLYRQMAPPVRNARSVQARNEARARLDEFAELGGAIRSELFRQSLHED